MTQISPVPFYRHPPSLDSKALQVLVRRYRHKHQVPVGWKPRKKVSEIVSEAFCLAALVDESRSPLLPVETAHHLREMALAVRTLHLEATRVRANREHIYRAETVRAQARHWMREMLGALRLLSPTDPEEKLPIQLGRVDTRDRTDDGLALEMHVVMHLGELHQERLTALGLDARFVGSGFQLSEALRKISAHQMDVDLKRREATVVRNGVAFALQERLKEVRSTLRYVHRADPDWLRRIAR